jgi:hypothetical protein
MANSDETEKALENAINQNAAFSKVKSRNITASGTDVVYEVRTKDEKALAKAVAGVEGVYSSSVLQHDGEVTL